MLAFIDKIVIPFLDGAVRRRRVLGVMLAMAIESAMIPLPSELILPYAGFLVSDPTPDRAADARPVEVLDRRHRRDARQHGRLARSRYAIGAWGGRPFLERYGKYLLIRHHEIELAERFFDRYGAATAFFSRLLPIVRTFISFPAGVARMPLGEVRRLLDGRRVPLVDPARLRGHGPGRQLGRHPPRAPAVRPGDRGRVVALVVALHLVAPREGRAGAGRRRLSGHPGVRIDAPPVTTREACPRAAGARCR